MNLRPKKIITTILYFAIIGVAVYSAGYFLVSRDFLPELAKSAGSLLKFDNNVEITAGKSLKLGGVARTNWPTEAVAKIGAIWREGNIYSTNPLYSSTGCGGSGWNGNAYGFFSIWSDPQNVINQNIFNYQSLRQPSGMCIDSSGSVRRVDSFCIGGWTKQCTAEPGGSTWLCFCVQ